MAIALPANAHVFTHDYYSSGGWSYGDSAGGNVFEIWEIGAKIENGKLMFSIWQNLPETGAIGTDSYEESAQIDPGDLWITIGTKNPFDPNATRHAIALTTHDNIVLQKYPNETWPTVTKGNLYLDAEHATGTYETYQKFMNDNGYWYTPDDLDGDDEKNSYMTLIKGFSQEISGQSAVTWTFEPYWDWSEQLNDWYLVDAWRITGWVELSAVGITPDTTFNIFISSECGNDGAVWEHDAIPEPGIGLAALSALTLFVRKRRRI